MLNIEYDSNFYFNIDFILHDRGIIDAVLYEDPPDHGEVNELFEEVFGQDYAVNHMRDFMHGAAGGGAAGPV